MQAPIKHHYVPVFYLKRWQGSDGRLCQFSLPHGQVVANRRHPSQTGFEENLYSMAGRPPATAQQVETIFLQKLDSLAAEALAALEAGDLVINRDARLRSAWSRFLMSMMHRGPTAVSGLKRGFDALMAKPLKEFQERYEALKAPDDPPSITEYLEQLGEGFEGAAMSMAPTLIDHPKIGELLNNMRWLLISISTDAGHCLTSDQPVLASRSLIEDDAHVIMPIGPKTMFLAVNNIATQLRVEAWDPKARVKSWNQRVIEQSLRFAYGVDDAEIEFVKEHFGRKRRPSLLEQLADRYEQGR